MKQMKNYRWVICALLFFATTINYIDRQVIGLLKPTLEKEFSWTETDYSRIVMTFQVAYALCLMIFGRIVDKIGVKLGYVVSIIIWSVAAMLHALVGSTLGFAAVRALLGLGEAGNFPAAIKGTAEWFPKKERAFATGIFNSGANIGAVVAPIMVPWILGIYGWRMAFIITGAIGFIWLIFWWIYYDSPEKQKRVTAEELIHIRSDQEENANEKPVSWASLFRIKQTYAFIFGKFFTDPIWWFFLFWLPSYFSSTFGLDLKKPSIELVLVYTATTIGSIGGGYLSGYFLKFMPLYKARKTAMLIFALCVVPIMLAQFCTNVWQAVALISLAAAAHQAWSANIYATAADMFPKKAISSVIGIGGMAGSIGGLFFPLLIGSMLDKYKALGNISAGYNIIFLVCGLAYVVAWFVMQYFAPKNEVVKI